LLYNNCKYGVKPCKEAAIARSEKTVLLAFILGWLGTAVCVWLLVHGKDPDFPLALPMNAELKIFLAAEDLDDVEDARHKIKSLSAKDEAAIRTILQEWKEPQAVSNLLMHPDLIPKDLRGTALLRGLDEQRVDYYVVAAIGGLDGARFSSEDQKWVARRLLVILGETKDVRAQQASLMLGRFVSVADAWQVIAAMNHPDRTVRHNLRWWVFERFKERGVGSLAAALARSGLREEAQRRLLAEFKEFVKIADQGGRYPRFSVLFPYIPNLKDYEPGEAFERRMP
jgi:hypothetical protein